MERDFIGVFADSTSLQALLEIVGCIPNYMREIYEKELPWLRTLLTSTKPDVRYLVAKVYGVITSNFSSIDFEKHISEIIDMTKKKHVESQHGSLLALTFMMERNLIIKRNENRDGLLNWEMYIHVVKIICTFVYIIIYRILINGQKTILIDYIYIFRYISS